MNNNPVGWFEIYVDDMDRARAFYETVFQTSLQPLTDPTDGQVQMWAFASDYEAHGTSGALIHVDEVKAGQNSTLVYFSCENCAQEESRVVEAGGQIKRPKMSIGDYGNISLVFDTEGNLIGLHSLK